VLLRVQGIMMVQGGLFDSPQLYRGIGRLNKGVIGPIERKGFYSMGKDKGKEFWVVTVESAPHRVVGEPCGARVEDWEAIDD